MLKNKLIFSSLVFTSVLSLIAPLAVFAAGPASINLLSAGNFAILAKTGISTTGTTLVTGDIGVSPAAATYITGFSLNLPASSAFSTSPLVVGKVYGTDYASPTPSNLTTAVSAMEAAYTNGAGRTNPTATELGAGNIGGMTLAPGLYKWGTDVTIPSDVTLNGSANDVWIFQISGKLKISSGKKVVLSGGAQVNNIFWVVAGQTTLETNSTLNGNILDQTAIVLNTGAVLNGRALAQTAVTLDANSVNAPSGTVTVATPAVPTVNPAVPATPASPSNSSGSGSYATPISENISPTLTSEQQLHYNQLLSVGVSPSNALNAINKISGQTSPASMPSASAFGQQVKAIATSLAQGAKGNNVSALQQFLISQNKGPAAKALADVGATAYFGGMTRAALAEFQAKVGISPALGNFGPITRAFLGANY